MLLVKSWSRAEMLPMIGMIHLLFVGPLHGGILSFRRGFDFVTSSGSDGTGH